MKMMKMKRKATVTDEPVDIWSNTVQATGVYSPRAKNNSSRRIYKIGKLETLHNGS